MLCIVLTITRLVCCHVDSELLRSPEGGVTVHTAKLTVTAVPLEVDVEGTLGLAPLPTVRTHHVV